MRERTLESIQRMVRSTEEIPELKRSLYILRHQINVIRKNGDYSITSVQDTSIRSMHEAMRERAHADPNFYFQYCNMVEKLFKIQPPGKLDILRAEVYWYIGWKRFRLSWFRTRI